MQTTTEDRGLVRRLAEPAPQPGHDVVVFEPIGSGRKHRITLGPDEVYRPPLAERLLHRDRKPIAFAVSRNRHRHTFSRAMPTVWEIALPVRATLEVSVADAKWVAENLDHDPLRSLEEEVAMRCAKAVRLLDVKDLDGQRVDPDRLVLEHLQEDAQHCQTTCRELLVGFAPSVGLTLHRITLEWSLPDDFLERTKQSIRQRHQAQLEKERESLDKDVRILKAEHGHTLRTLTEDHANEEAVQRREREDLEHAARLTREVRSSLAQKVKDTIANQPSGSLSNIVTDIGTLDRQLGLLKQPQVPALPDNGSRQAALAGDGLPKLLGDLLDLAADERYESPVRRRLLADGLRTIAAAVDGGAEEGEAGEQADPVTPEASIRAILGELARDHALASKDHQQLLRKLGDPKALCALGWAGLRDDA